MSAPAGRTAVGASAGEKPKGASSRGALDAIAAFQAGYSDFGTLPDGVRQQARRCLIDLIGVAAAGSRTALGALIAAHASEQFGAGGKPASILFDARGRTASAAGAALAGGMTIDADAASSIRRKYGPRPECKETSATASCPV